MEITRINGLCCYVTSLTALNDPNSVFRICVSQENENRCLLELQNAILCLLWSASCSFSCEIDVCSAW